MNKKGEIAQIGFWMLIIIFLTVIFGVIYAVTNSFVESQTDTKNFNLYLFERRLLLSPDCLAFEEKYSDGSVIKTIYGTIDLLKMTTENLEKCLDSEKFGARVFIEFLDDPMKKEAFVNKDYYEEYKPLSRFEGYKSYYSKKLVTVINGDNKLSGFITFDLVQEDEK